jgi:hypothetical protein
VPPFPTEPAYDGTQGGWEKLDPGVYNILPPSPPPGGDLWDNPPQPHYLPHPFTEQNWAGIAPNNRNDMQSPDSTTPKIYIPNLLLTDADRGSIYPSARSSPTPPVSAVPPVLISNGFGGAGRPEDSLQDGQLGVSLSIQRQRAYTEAYWRYFHQLFPIIHRQRFTQYTQVRGPKLLLAAIMAIGAQYAQELFAGSDSRILHERCQELIAKVRTSKAC